MIYDVAIVISLERREDRSKFVFEHLKKRGVQNVYQFPAYDGNLLPSHIKITPPKRPYFSWTSLNNYQIACSLSHAGAMKMAKGLEAERALIFEDDAVVSKDFTSRLDLLEKEIKENNIDWEHIYLGGVPRRPSELEVVTPHLYKSGFTDGLHAYLVDRRGMTKVSDEMIKFMTTNDDSTNDISQSGELKSFVCLPFCSYQRSDFSELDQKFVMRNDMMQYYKEVI